MNARVRRVICPQYYPQRELGVWNLGGGRWGLGFGTLLGPEESGPWPRCGGVGLFFLCLLSLVGARGGVGSGVGGWGV